MAPGITPTPRPRGHNMAQRHGLVPQTELDPMEETGWMFKGSVFGAFMPLSLNERCTIHFHHTAPALMVTLGAFRRF